MIIKHYNNFLNEVKRYTYNMKYRFQKNNLVLNLAIFFNIFFGVTFLPKIKSNIFFIMIQDLALDNPYGNISIIAIIFQFGHNLVFHLK